MTTDTTEEAGIVQEPTLPGMELPEHFGRTPISQTTKFTGSGDRIFGEHEVGSRVVYLVEGTCRGNGLSQDADGKLTFSESFAINDLFEIHGAAGPRLLSAMRQAYRVGDDEEIASRIKVEGPDAITDGSGVMMTAAEVAQLRGDPLAAAFDKRMSPAVIVYSDGAREMWPEEFEAMTPRPVAGEVYETADGAETVVRKVLDAVTGETLQEWTDGDEKKRLDAADTVESEDDDGDEE